MAWNPSRNTHVRWEEPCVGVIADFFAMTRSFTIETRALSLPSPMQADGSTHIHALSNFRWMDGLRKVENDSLQHVLVRRRLHAYPSVEPFSEDGWPTKVQEQLIAACVGSLLFDVHAVRSTKLFNFTHVIAQHKSQWKIAEKNNKWVMCWPWRTKRRVQEVRTQCSKFPIPSKIAEMLVISFSKCMQVERSFAIALCLCYCGTP